MWFRLSRPWQCAPQFAHCHALASAGGKAVFVHLACGFNCSKLWKYSTKQMLPSLYRNDQDLSPPAAMMPGCYRPSVYMLDQCLAPTHTCLRAAAINWTPCQWDNGQPRLLPDTCHFPTYPQPPPITLISLCSGVMSRLYDLSPQTRCSMNYASCKLVKFMQSSRTCMNSVVSFQVASLNSGVITFFTLERFHSWKIKLHEKLHSAHHKHESYSFQTGRLWISFSLLLEWFAVIL